jgi:hypothetical protein
MKTIFMGIPQRNNIFQEKAQPFDGTVKPIAIYLDMVEKQTVRCLNCNTEFQGNFCFHCGQKASVTRLTWKSLLDEFLHFFTHAEHSFIYTSKQLVVAPGVIVKAFLDGQRKKVHKPVTFLLIWLAILKIFTGFFQYAVKHWGLYQFSKTEPDFRILWTGPKNPFITNYENLLIVLVQAPVLIIVGLSVFRKTKNTFVESWVAILYATALTCIVGVGMEISTFIFRLLKLPLTTGILNDSFLLLYIITGIWVIFSFEKVYRPMASRAWQLVIALILSVFATYASDLVFYCLYRYFPA